MTDVDRLALSDELARDAATYAAGTPTRKLLHKAADALRLSASPAPGAGGGPSNGFEAGLRAAKEVALHRARIWKRSDGGCSTSLWDECMDIAAAIAAIPIPAAEESVSGMPKVAVK